MRIEATRTRAKKGSTLTAALGKLLQAHQDRQKLDALEAAEEEQEWGAFASSQFVATRQAEGRTEVS